MIGKIGMTPAFKGTIQVVCRESTEKKDLERIRNIKTEDIMAINQDISCPEYTNIVVYNPQKDKTPTVYIATNKYASKQDIIAAYTAAKGDQVTISAINL